MGNEEGMSLEVTDVLSVDTTDVLLADTTDVLSADTTGVLSADRRILEMPQPGFARFGTPKIETGHYLNISGDLPAESAGVALTRRGRGSPGGPRSWGHHFSYGSKGILGPCPPKLLALLSRDIGLGFGAGVWDCKK